MDLANIDDDVERAAGIRQVFSADYVLHPRTDPDVVGVETYIKRLEGSRMPNMRFAMDDLIAQGDRFAMRYHWTARHGGGHVGNAALEINRVANGQVVETWNYQDMMSLMIQLGVIANPFDPT